jgi:plasmid stability protein
MNLTLSVDDEVVRQARLRAEAMGKSVNQLVREYLEQLAGRSDREALVAELRELTRNSTGDSRGWKFNREEIHERR